MAAWQWFAAGWTKAVNVSWVSFEAPQPYPAGSLQVSWAALEAPALPVPEIRQTKFRFRNDDGNESNASWRLDENLNLNIFSAGSFRLRTLLQETSGAQVSTGAVSLEFSYNLGSWVALTSAYAAGRPAKITPSPNVTDDAATTQQMTGTGTFVPGKFDENPGFGTSGVTLPAYGNTEYEFSVALDSAQIVAGDNLRFRISRVSGGEFDGYVYPTIIVGNAATIKYWNGSSWSAKPVKRWNGSSWQTLILERWTGTLWSAPAVPSTPPGTPTIGTTVQVGFGAEAHWTVGSGGSPTRFEVDTIDDASSTSMGVDLASPSATSLISSHASQGNTVRFRVRAYNSGGYSSWSTDSNVITIV